MVSTKIISILLMFSNVEWFNEIEMKRIENMSILWLSFEKFPFLCEFM